MEVFQIIKKMEFYEHEFTFNGNVYTLEIEGSFYNVMGLPVQQLYEALRRFPKKS